MKKLLGSAFLLLSITAASPALAQSFGERFPVTNTRYGTAFGLPHLTTNGSDFFLFWTSARKIRATQLIEGGARAGHVVLDGNAVFDVAWTGERFLAVTTRGNSSYPFEKNIVGRFLDADARPAGSEHVIAQHGSIPRVAAGPESLLLVYRDTNDEIRSLPLAADGANTGAASVTIAPRATSYAVAANAKGFIAAIADSTGIRAVALDEHGQVKASRTLTHGGPDSRDVSVATDGTSYVAVWCEEQAVVAATIDPNGTFGTPLVIDSSMRPYTPTVIWNGAGWTITYAGQRLLESRARVVQLDREAQRIIAEEESAEGLGSPSVAALDGRIVAAWAPVSHSSSGVSVIDLPLAANQPRPATFAATEQTLMATASSAEATLIVWTEGGDGRTSLRAGLRTNDGRWRESELAVVQNVQQVLAGSDGRNFVILYPQNGMSGFIRLNEKGQMVGYPTTLPITPWVMAWNGTHYALIDGNDNTGSFLSPSGTLSEPVAIPDISFLAQSLVSDGNGFLLAGESWECVILICSSDGMLGTRLGPDLRRIDPYDFLLEKGSGEIAAAWNGSEYVLIWGESGGTRVARVPPAPLQPIVTLGPYSVPLFAEGLTAMSDGSIAIVGHSPESSGSTRVAILSEDGNVAKTYDIENTLGTTGRARLAPLPNDGLAYVASSVQNAAPHHGTSHVMMAIAQPSVISPPSPPYVTARLRDGFVLVDWSASAGTVNGYRLEYRIDNGSWNELEEWFSPGSHHRTIRPSFGTDFEIRMRAFNDGGASAYSETASTKPIRRRAATH